MLQFKPLVSDKKENGCRRVKIENSMTAFRRTTTIYPGFIRLPDILMTHLITLAGSAVYSECRSCEPTPLGT